jgi:glycosyltransferase involved in cell wall biosynthesis
VTGLLPRLIFRSRLIFDVHDLSVDMFAMRFEGRRGATLAERALAWAESAALYLADHVITVHEAYRRELVRRGAELEQTSVVMNTLDRDLLPQGVAPVAANGPRVVYHGTLTPPYGVDLLVEAAVQVRERVPGLRVEIYGGGDAVEDLRRQIDGLGLGACVSLHPAVEQRDVLDRIRGAAAGVIPNRPSRLNRYALSSKLFEYVELGIPVVSAGLPTIREHFADVEVAFFTPGDADALADALAETLLHPEAASRRAAAAAQRAREYAWEHSAQRYLALLEPRS